jgi:hypothetical protein
VELLQSPAATVATPALRCIGNIVTGDDLQTQVAINAGVLPALGALLGHDKKSIRKESAWAASNVTAGNAEQIQAVLNAGLIAPLIHVLTTDDYEVRKEAAWSLSNATSGGTPDQIRFLVAHGALPALVSVLSNDADARIIQVGQEGIENILRVGMMDGQAGADNPFCEALEACGGLDRLEELQNHPTSEEVYSKALAILETYFDVGSDGDGDEPAEAAVAPMPQGGGFAFAPPAPAGGGDVGALAEGVQAMVVEELDDEDE